MTADAYRQTNGVEGIQGNNEAWRRSQHTSSLNTVRVLVSFMAKERFKAGFGGGKWASFAAVYWEGQPGGKATQATENMFHSIRFSPHSKGSQKLVPNRRQSVMSGAAG